MKIDKKCGCGSHEHKHEDGGCCGSHEHNHGDNHHHNHYGMVHGHFNPADSPLESYLLKTLKAAHFLPVVQFIMKSEKSSHFESIALSPVFMVSESDDIEKIKTTGAALKILENQGFLTLDYDIPLDNYSYDEYKNSAVYKEFTLMMEEAATRDGFVYDSAELNFGSIALTDKGEATVATLL